MVVAYGVGSRGYSRYVFHAYDMSEYVSKYDTNPTPVRSTSQIYFFFFFSQRISEAQPSHSHRPPSHPPLLPCRRSSRREKHSGVFVHDSYPWCQHSIPRSHTTLPALPLCPLPPSLHQAHHSASLSVGSRPHRPPRTPTLRLPSPESSDSAPQAALQS